jgi:hypothetical protein
VKFMIGTTVIGTGTLDATGKTTAQPAFANVGAQAVTAVYSGDANYATATSSAVTITVVPTFALSAAPAAIYLSAGEYTPVTVNVAGNASFAGTIAFTCTSPVTYITCAMTPASATVTAGNGTSTLASITIAATGSLRNAPLAPRQTVWLAVLLPLGMLGLARNARRRKGWKTASLLAGVLTAILIGVSGCSSSSPSTTSTPSNLPPIGANSVTVTATSGAVTGSTVITVNVLN